MGRTAYPLRVQTGCDETCAYCIIPSTRGASRSRPLDEVVADVGALWRAATRNSWLVGVHLGSYGRDLTARSSLARPGAGARSAARRRDVPHQFARADGLLRRTRRSRRGVRPVRAALSPAAAARAATACCARCGGRTPLRVVPAARSHRFARVDAARLRLAPTSSSGFPARPTRTSTSARRLLADGCRLSDAARLPVFRSPGHRGVGDARRRWTASRSSRRGAGGPRTSARATRGVRAGPGWAPSAGLTLDDGGGVDGQLPEGADSRRGPRERAGAGRGSMPAPLGEPWLTDGRNYAASH